MKVKLAQKVIIVRESESEISCNNDYCEIKSESKTFCKGNYRERENVLVSSELRWQSFASGEYVESQLL